MKRTNLVLNENLLDEATRILGAKTYSAAVNTALAEVVRIRKILSLPSFFGRELWHGNLAEMREDRHNRMPHRSRGHEKKK
jgi:Arc/MetJ family transcription regulator